MGMATIVEHEAQQIEQANATGRTPVVFIHGLWFLPSSRWARWARVFDRADYTPLTPGWPDDFETVEEAKARPEVFAHKTIKQVEAKVDTKNPDRGPLLIISGEKDNTVPWAIANAAFKKQQRNNGVTESSKCRTAAMRSRSTMAGGKSLTPRSRSSSDL
ncbi:MAG TPA: hypothetical protein VE645_07490 [Pseudonocardiaceae bacterium]|nr:hypothetical protein [Pseudonocardiaceae bacterium]